MRPQAVTDNMTAFFSLHLHDSLAGFMGLGVHEFKGGGVIPPNQLGLAKHRTVFWGNA